MSYVNHSPSTSSLHSVSRTVTPIDLTHVLSAQHLDHVSTYLASDHDADHDAQNNEAVFSNHSEHVMNQDEDETIRQGDDEVSGVLNAQDLEASLEKKQSARSVRHLNLVQ